MGVKYYILLLLLCMSFVAADSSKILDKDCSALCARAKLDDTVDFKDVADCFSKNLNNADAYLATATCAYNNHVDAEAEKYAIKSVRAKFAWIAFLRRLPGLNRVWKTGGIGETYTLAYMATGGSRYESTAIGYLKTSGQCMKASDRQTCAEQYFQSVVSRYESRNLQAARTSGPSSAGITVNGRITDHFGNPIKHAKVTFICGRLTLTNVTDADGRYNLPIPDSVSPTDICLEAKLYVKFEYHQPGDYNKIYTRVMFNGQPVWAMKKIKIRGLNDLNQDFQIKKGMTEAEYGGRPNARDVYHYGVIYHHTVQALEFYKDFLKINVDYKLPVDVLPFIPGDGTYYTPTTASIIISHKDSKLTDSDRPKNREWHEFSHHAMYSMYRKWPKAPAGAVPPTKNHGGYMNPTTSDSFLEGFAEFMSLVIADHLKESSADVYASFGSLDRDIKAFDRRGYHEELAVAGVLWDLYDAKNDDKVDLTLNQVWNVLKTYQKDFTSVYDAMITKFPGFKNDINEIFKDHGFYQDKTRGSGNWTREEPFRDANGNKWWDPGEHYVDFAQEPLMAYPYMIWQTGEKIGSAANYNRLTRRNTVMRPGSLIKVDNNVPVYKITVEFQDNPEWNYITYSDNEDGFVHVGVPPPGFKAKVTVEPEGAATKNPLIFDSEKFNENFFEADLRGYFVEHSFGVGNVDIEEPEMQEESAYTPYWEAYDIEAVDSDFEYNPPVEEDVLGEEKGFPWVSVLLVLCIAAGIVLYVIKRPKRKKKKKK